MPLNFDFFIPTFNESFMGLHKWQHISSHRGVEQIKLPWIQLSLEVLI